MDENAESREIERVVGALLCRHWENGRPLEWGKFEPHAKIDGWVGYQDATGPGDFVGVFEAKGRRVYSIDWNIQRDGLYCAVHKVDSLRRVRNAHPHVKAVWVAHLMDWVGYIDVGEIDDSFKRCGIGPTHDKWGYQRDREAGLLIPLNRMTRLL